MPRRWRGQAERMRRLIGIVLGCALAVSSTPAPAQPYPNRPIRLFVSFPPGGAADLVARVFGQALSVRLGQPVVIENRPGANGNLAGDAVAKAEPDGHTLLLGPSALFSINPHLYAKMPIDPLKELLPVASLVQNALLLAANPALARGKDFSGFVALARATRPPLFYASIGNGSLHHIAMEMLKEEARIKLTHVPYRGGGPAGIAVLAGDVAAMFGGGSVFPMVKSGQLRGLAVSSRKRSTELRELPSISELYPNYEATIWQGLFAPAGMPQEITDRLRKEVGAILETKDFADKLAKTGSGEPYVTTLDEFKARIHRDFERYGRIVKAAGVQVH